MVGGSKTCGQKVVTKDNFYKSTNYVFSTLKGPSLLLSYSLKSH